MAPRRRVAVIGLDCGTPQLLFGKYLPEMPHLSALLERSVWGPMQSTVPPITVPAWSCMMSGLTPGELGIYGFRNRRGHDYAPMGVASCLDVRRPRLWDLVGDAGGQSVLIGVPGTYPAPQIDGVVVGDFLSSKQGRWTWPGDVADELFGLCGEYQLDVTNFRTHDKARVAQQLFDMTEQRFQVARHLMTTRPWDLFAMVDMGFDRLHHAFWSLSEEDHPRHDPNGPHVSLFRDYYRAVDAHLGALLEVVPSGTDVLVVSDHGGQPMLGGFCINEWLLDRGYLVLRHVPDRPTAIGDADVDWGRTLAWADGGYYARVFLNVAGREPDGVIPPGEYGAVKAELAVELEAVPDHTGALMGTVALSPEEIYPEVHGVAPDLIVYPGNLRWRSVGTLGLGQGWYTFENDTGPDDANHAELGVFALAADGVDAGPRAGLSIYDVAPTLQSRIGLTAPLGQRGRVLA